MTHCVGMWAVLFAYVDRHCNHSDASYPLPMSRTSMTSSETCPNHRDAAAARCLSNLYNAAGQAMNRPFDVCLAVCRRDGKNVVDLANCGA
jgi:hypothetical protein